MRTSLVVLLSSLVATACGGKSSAKTDAPVKVADAPPIPTAPGAPTAVTAAAVSVTAMVSTLAGTGLAGSANGSGTVATFSGLRSLALDSAGNIYVADIDNNLIREVTPAGEVSTLAGTGSAGSANGSATAATFNMPTGVAVDPAGNVYVSDSVNHLIREITSAGVVSTLAGTGAAGSADGSASAASFEVPDELGLDSSGNLDVVDSGDNLVRQITPTGQVNTVAGTGAVGSANGPGSAASFDEPTGLAVGAAGNVYIADTANNKIRELMPTGFLGEVTTLAGTGAQGSANGPGSAATFDNPFGVAADASGNVYVADTFNFLIRVVTPAGVVSTLAGGTGSGSANGSGSAASFGIVVGIVVDGLGNVYVGDTGNHLLRKIVTAGIGELAVSWTAPSDLGDSAITGYTASASATGFATKTCTALADTCTIIGLTTGATYSISVIATNAVGDSAASAAVTAIPN